VIYRKLGHTGYTISQLGFGAMRLPMNGDGTDALVNRDLAIPMIHRAFELGITYIDTARGYCNEDSQRAVGEALESWGDRKNIVVSTKNPYFGPDEKIWWTNLENSLRRLRVDSIDIYNYHGINWKIFTEDIEPRVSTWMRKAYDQGLVKHICASFHDSNEALYALLLAHKLTGGAIYEEWYDRVHEYSFARHPDPDYGEWFGYLHRDGTVSHTFKGSSWKGCFHLPRQLLYSWLLLKEMEGRGYEKIN